MRSRNEASALGCLVLIGLGCQSAPAAPGPPVPQLALPADAGSAPIALSERLQALVLNLGGAVEVRRGGSSAWVALSVGDPIQVGDKVRMAADGQLELSFDVAKIKMHEGSEFELTLLEPHEVRVAVTGTVEAEMPGGEVSISGGTAVAHTRGGRVSFTYDGNTATASSLAGEVSLTSAQQTVALGAGEFAATLGGGMTRPAKMPRTLSLEVTWPTETETNKPSITVKGRVSARSRVVMGGSRVEPAADGTFEGKVPLKPGRQTVTITAFDAFGRRATRARQFVMDPNAVKIKGAVEYQ